MTINVEQYNLVLIGDGGVGKTALAIQFLQNYFVEDYDPTIEDTYKKECTIDGQRIILNILDTSGQLEYRSLLNQYIKHGQGFIIVFSVDNRMSFSYAKSLYDQILMVRHVDMYPVVLVGNKTDLINARQVTKLEAEEVAKRWRAPYYETSAKQRLNVDQIFYGLVKEIHTFNKLKASTGTDVDETAAGVTDADKKAKNDCSLM